MFLQTMDNLNISYVSYQLYRFCSTNQNDVVHITMS